MTTQQTVILILAVVALAFAGAEEVMVRGTSLVSWSAILISVALIYQQVV